MLNFDIYKKIIFLVKCKKMEFSLPFQFFVFQKSPIAKNFEAGKIITQLEKKKLKKNEYYNVQSFL